jgi:hypothetical protein
MDVLWRIELHDLGRALSADGKAEVLVARIHLVPFIAETGQPVRRALEKEVRSIVIDSETDKRFERLADFKVMRAEDHCRAIARALMHAWDSERLASPLLPASLPNLLPPPPPKRPPKKRRRDGG